MSKGLAEKFDAIVTNWKFWVLWQFVQIGIVLAYVTVPFIALTGGSLIGLIAAASTPLGQSAGWLHFWNFSDGIGGTWSVVEAPSLYYFLLIFMVSRIVTRRGRYRITATVLILFTVFSTYGYISTVDW